MTELNLYTWFSQRELHYCPKHFIVIDHLIAVESKQWILEKLTPSNEESCLTIGALSREKMRSISEASKSAELCALCAV